MFANREIEKRYYCGVYLRFGDGVREQENINSRAFLITTLGAVELDKRIDVESFYG